MKALSMFWATALTRSTALPIPPTTPHAAFVYDSVYGNITFSVTAVRDVGDLYFHLEAPADNSWVAVGTGGLMKDSLMWVVYRSGDEKGVTLSPRTVHGHVEPSYNNQTECDLNVSDGVTNGILYHNDHDVFVVNGYCKGINNKSFTKQKRYGGEKEPQDENDDKFSFDKTRQPFIFALGPTSRQLHEDKKDAGIRRHSMYGVFSMDLTKATVESSVDVAHDELSAVGTWENHNAQLIDSPTKDGDWGGSIHSLLMCGTFVVLFPVGVILLRLLEQVRSHAWMQGIGMVVAICGVALGIRVGKEYNQSRQVKSPHQIIGLAIIVVIILQFALGFAHHLLYKKHKRPTILGRIHLYLGPLVLIIGAANGFLGFNFSGRSSHNTMYGIIVGVMSVGLIGALFYAQRRRVAKARREDQSVQDEAYEAFKHEESATEGLRSVQLREIPSEAPPAYSAYSAYSAYEYEGRPAQPRAWV